MDPKLESSFELIGKARGGDREALNRLCERYLPNLERWASGRLPNWARDLMSTQDLVQETFVNTIKKLEHFEHRREGALQAYLRQALRNRIQDEIRRIKRRPPAEREAQDEADRDCSPVEKVIGREAMEHYEVALAKLDPEDREVLIARIEMGMSYEELAQSQGKPTANAARMAVSRALLRLAKEMERARG